MEVVINLIEDNKNKYRQHSNTKIKDDDYFTNEFMVKDLDTGKIFDVRNPEDSHELDDQIKTSNIKKKVPLEEEDTFQIENLKIQEKINTKFFKACERGEIDKIMNLLDKKKSKDRQPNINEKYLHNYTVMHIAVSNSHLDVTNILLEYNADIEAETSMKRRPIHLASIRRDFKIIDLLASCGAEVNCQDIDNNTPLHLASKLGYAEIVEYFLHKRADFSLKNIYGETPLDIISNIKIYDIFLGYIGEENINNYRNAYTRLILNKRVFHNNLTDNIKKILYKDNLISQKFINSNTHKNLFLSSINEEIDFPNNSEVDVDSFKIIELLGKGSFGQVYLVELKITKKKYAMKVLNKNKIVSQNILRYVKAERNILSNIKHPFIVKLYYAFQTDEFLYLILEYCEARDLSFHLRKLKFFSEEIVRILLAQLLLAIGELHKNGIIYRDLKPENIVLDSEGFIKLTDFGLSKEGINDNSSAKSFCGSLAYLAPEILYRQGHGKSVDWYLFGVLMYEMLHGIPPYYTNISKDALFYNIKHGKLNFNKKISSDAKNLILKLLNRNPLKRLGSGVLDSDEIKSHSFFGGIDFGKILAKDFTPPKLYNQEMIEISSHKLLGVNDIIQNKELVEDMKANKKSASTCIEGWTFVGNNKLKIMQV